MHVVRSAQGYLVDVRHGQVGVSKDKADAYLFRNPETAQKQGEKLLTGRVWTEEV